jgi:hypothetical protein
MSELTYTYADGLQLTRVKLKVWTTHWGVILVLGGGGLKSQEALQGMVHGKLFDMKNILLQVGYVGR